MWSPDFLGHQVFQKSAIPSDPKSLDEHRRHHVHLFRPPSRRLGIGRREFYLFMGNLHRSRLYRQTTDSRRRDTDCLVLYHCIRLGLSHGFGDLAACIERCADCRRLCSALEAGMEMTRKGKTTQSAAIVVFSSALVNPVFGWSLTMLLDNLGLIGCKERSAELGFMGRVVVPTVGFVILCAAMGAVGMLPGIPAFLEQFRNLH